MTTMSIQLLRVVYLLVVLYFLSCEAQVIYGQKMAKCPELREEDLEHAERIMNRSWFGPESPLAEVKSPQEILANGSACVDLWGKEVNACNKNYADMETALNATTEVVEGIEKFLEGKPEKKTESCQTEAVRKFVEEFNQMKAKYNNAADAADGLVDKVNKTKRECSFYVANLRDPADKLKGAVKRYEEMVLDRDYIHCDLARRKETLELYTARSKVMERVMVELSNLSGETHACGLKSKGGVRFLLEKKYERFREHCPAISVGAGARGFHQVVDEVKKENQPVLNRGESREKSSRKDDIKAFKDKFDPLQKIHAKEVVQVEKRIKAAAEERKARRAREKQEAEERAKREEEERKRKEEEVRKAAEEEKKRKAEEEKAMRAAQKAEEEKARQEAAQKATEEAEKAKQAAEKATKKKDGGSSLALVQSSLILLVLSVLGCIHLC